MLGIAYLTIVGRIIGVTVIVPAILCEGATRAKGASHRMYMQKDI